MSCNRSMARGPVILLLLAGMLAWPLCALTSSTRGDEGSAKRQHATPDARPFAEIVREHFAAWDLDRDGRLESAEIDRLAARKDIQGEAAAALAAVKLRERGVKPAAERKKFFVTLEQLTAPHAGGQSGSSDAARKGAHEFHYESHYRRNVRVLASLERRLFRDNLPDFTRMRQGEIGDCYFFSLTGYLAHHEPRRLVQMIEAGHNGDFTVRFGTGDRVHVPAPTDVEILINNSSSSLEDGLWLPVLEKALGEVMRSRQAADKRTAEATDAMASGGPTSLIIHLYSGHRGHHFPLHSARHADMALGELRHALPEALAHRRLVGVNMDDQPPGGRAKIPGLGYGHAYALLAFDPRHDAVTVWNPWGNTFRPKGEEGPEHGFSTERGVFQLSLETLCRNFSSVHIETLEPARVSRGRK